MSKNMEKWGDACEEAPAEGYVQRNLRNNPRRRGGGQRGRYRSGGQFRGYQMEGYRGDGNRNYQGYQERENQHQINVVVQDFSKNDDGVIMKIPSRAQKQRQADEPVEKLRITITEDQNERQVTRANTERKTGHPYRENDRYRHERQDHKSENSRRLEQRVRRLEEDNNFLRESSKKTQEKLQKELRSLKVERVDLKQEIIDLKHELKAESKVSVSPNQVEEMQRKIDQLTLSLENEKQENQSLQSQILEMKEKESEEIATLRRRIQELEESGKGEDVQGNMQEDAEGDWLFCTRGTNFTVETVVEMLGFEQNRLKVVDAKELGLDDYLFTLRRALNITGVELPVGEIGRLACALEEFFVNDFSHGDIIIVVKNLPEIPAALPSSSTFSKLLVLAHILQAISSAWSTTADTGVDPKVSVVLFGLSESSIQNMSTQDGKLELNWQDIGEAPNDDEDDGEYVFPVVELTRK